MRRVHMKRLLLKAPIMRFVELARCRRGVVAVEFALIIPFLVTLLYGTAELGNIYMLDRKINRSAQIGADLVAQVETVSTSDLEDVMDAMDQIVSPFGTTTRKIKVSQIYYDPVDDQIEIDWSVARNDTPLTGGDVYTLPGNLVASGESVIIVSYEYTYTPTYATFLGSFTIVDEAYLRPRLTTRVEKT